MSRAVLVRALMAIAAGMGVLLAEDLGAEFGQADKTPPADRLVIVAPAPTGGGWDQTARAMERALLDAGAAKTVTVVNSPGAGGVIGLAEFVNAERGRADTLLVGGLVMLSAVRANRASVSLAQTTPVARLTGVPQALVVKAGSRIRTLAEFTSMLRADPVSAGVGGGSVGGADHLLFHQLIRALGMHPESTNYVPFPNGTKVAEALLAGQITAGISEYGELASAIGRGDLRALAVSGVERLPGLRTPTFREQGIELAFLNWRGVFAPPGLSDAECDRLRALVASMRDTPAWRDALAQNHWRDLFLSGDDFVEFLVAEEGRVPVGPDPRQLAAPVSPGALSAGMWLLRHRVSLGAAVAALVCSCVVGLLLWHRVETRRREAAFARQLAEAEASYQARSIKTQEVLRGLGDHIDKHFEAWSLTTAERDVAWMMLKGYHHKEIAALRGRSERTVRTQALSVYRKAGLEGRTDLAAYFLEDFLPPHDANDPPTTS